MKNNLLSLLMLFFLVPLNVFAGEGDCHGNSEYAVKASFEYGFAGIVGHEIQFGENNPRFDFIKEGGQKTLFPHWRAGVAFHFLKDHSLELIYQPIYLDTEGSSTRETRFDNVIFDANTPLNARYYFPYYRLSYFYQIIRNSSFNLSVGGGLQVRNTAISFANADGTKRFATTNMGPVPLITSRIGYTFANNMWISADIGGIWAPIPGLNGSNNPVTGWLYDCAVSFGLNMNKEFSGFLSGRIIGGGAQGDGAARDSGQKYSYNSLNSLTFSTGLIYQYDGFL